MEKKIKKITSLKNPDIIIVNIYNMYLSRIFLFDNTFYMKSLLDVLIFFSQGTLR